MSILKATAPGSTPATWWPEATDWLNKLLIQREVKSRMSTGFITKGSMFNIGGSMFYTDADTTISGVDTGVVKFTVSGDTASPSYVDVFTGVAWNPEYNGWYDVDENLYLVDETRQVKVRKPGTNLVAGFQRTLQVVKGVSPYDNSGYKDVAVLTFTDNQRLPAYIKEFHLKVVNADDYYESQLRVINGSTVLDSWTDVPLYEADISVESLIASGSMEIKLQYKEYGATDNRGPFTVDVSYRVAPDCPFGDSDYQLALLAANSVTAGLVVGV